MDYTRQVAANPDVRASMAKGSPCFLAKGRERVMNYTMKHRLHGQGEHQSSSISKSGKPNFDTINSLVTILR
jgi:hypothetical protein